MQKKKSTTAKSGDEKLLRKYEKTLLRPTTPTKSKKETRRLTELKNPTAITVDEQEQERLGLRKRPRDDAELADRLLPRRENQSRDSLAIKTVHPQLESPGATPPEKTLYHELFDINRSLHRARNEHTFPLEELIGHGLLSSELLSVDEKQTLLAKECEADATFIANQLLQLHQTPEGEALRLKYSQAASSATLHDRTDNKENALVRSAGDQKKKTNGETSLSSVVKLSMIFGRFEYSFGYEKRNLTENRERIFQQFDEDRESRRLEFFRHDPIEDETPFALRPMRYKMFRELTTQNLHKYRARDATLLEASRHVPKRTLEEVSREYIHLARQRPSPGTDQTCFNGQRCLFYTFSADPLVRYIGRPFYTERQQDQLKRGESLQDNAEGLCIDCLLMKWSLEHAKNISCSYAPACAMNHFTVKVGPGQYSRRCMLDPVYNDLETGIVGHVPRYDPKQREVVLASRRTLERKSASTNLESYIGETGMDF